MLSSNNSGSWVTTGGQMPLPGRRVPYRTSAYQQGGNRWWLARAVPLLDSAGAIVKWVGTCTDIDELKQAQIRVGEQAEFLNASHEAILVMDLEDHIIYWNDGAVRTYGYTALEAMGCQSWTALH